MPQMMPINWIFSFFFFIMIFIIFSMLNYFIYKNKNNTNLLKENINYKNNFIYWKW